MPWPQGDVGLTNPSLGLLRLQTGKLLEICLLEGRGESLGYTSLISLHICLDTCVCMCIYVYTYVDMSALYVCRHAYTYTFSPIDLDVDLQMRYVCVCMDVCM